MDSGGGARPRRRGGVWVTGGRRAVLKRARRCGRVSLGGGGGRDWLLSAVSAAGRGAEAAARRDRTWGFLVSAARPSR